MSLGHDNLFPSLFDGTRRVKGIEVLVARVVKKRFYSPKCFALGFSYSLYEKLEIYYVNMHRLPTIA